VGMIAQSLLLIARGAPGKEKPANKRHYAETARVAPSQRCGRRKFFLPNLFLPNLRSGGEGFNDARGRFGRHHPRKPESCFIEQFAILRLRPFLSPCQDQHSDVEPLPMVRSVAGRKHHLDDQQSAARLHRAAAVAKDGHALPFTPVVDDMGEQISVAAGGHVFEETAGCDRDAIR